MSYTFCSCSAIVILGCTPGAVDLLVQGILSCAWDTSRCFDQICFHILLVLWLVEHFKLPYDILVLQILHITELLSPSDISKCFHTCDFILNVRNVNVLEFEGNNVNDSQIIVFFYTLLYTQIPVNFPKVHMITLSFYIMLFYYKCNYPSLPSTIHHTTSNAPLKLQSIHLSRNWQVDTFMTDKPP